MSLTENKAQTEIAALVAAQTLARPMIVANIAKSLAGAVIIEGENAAVPAL